MNILGMSGLMFASLSLLLCILMLTGSPSGFEAAMALKFPLTSFQQSIQGIAPPVPFAIAAMTASIFALRTEIGKIAMALSTLSFAVIYLLFLWN